MFNPKRFQVAKMTYRIGPLYEDTRSEFVLKLNGQDSLRDRILRNIDLVSFEMFSFQLYRLKFY